MLYAILAILAALLVILHTGVLLKTYLHTKMGMTVSFFMGFIVLQAILSWQSIFLPVNTGTLVGWLGLLAILSFLKLNHLKAFYGGWFSSTSIKTRGFITVLLFVFGYALSAEITLYDTGLYHTQAIKWIREYAVVPGLGNLHGRFAFNSHFFIASALFTVDLSRAGESILIYPLNAAAMLVFLGWMFKNVLTHSAEGNRLKTITHAIVMLFCLFLYPAWLNSPSPDIIRAILVLFAFFFVWEADEWNQQNFAVLAAVIFTAIVIKLSSAFLILLLVPAFFSRLKNNISESPPSPQWRGGWGVRSTFEPSPLSSADSYREDRGLGGEVLKKPSPSIRKRITKLLSFLILIGLFILPPFFIRNYYLSGYFVYPTTAIDVFNVEWKIPAETVEAEKLHISTWAKVPRVADEEVAAMKLSQWFPIWWQRKTFPFKVLLGGCLLSFVAFTLLIKQKKAKEIGLLAVVWANLIFWFFTAPDPRFVHGFLIFGFALGFAVLFQKIMPVAAMKPALVLPAFAMLALGAMATIRENPKDILLNHTILPKALAENPLQHVDEPFQHVVPVGNNRCYNAELPCLPEENTRLEQRAAEVKFGYKTLNPQP